MADKYKKLKRQVSTDGGFTWTDIKPYEYKAGELIQRDSPDCNNVEWRTVSGYICEENTTEITQWVADTGYVCVGFDKYNKEKEQVSYNSGISWTDTGNTRAGSTLIEQNSEDCGYVPPITRWVEDTGYMCVGYDKYNKEKEQQSTDGGATWTDTGNTRAGSTLIEANSTDCGYIEPIYQWVNVSGEYACVGYDKYNKEKKQISYDSGSTWEDTGETRAGSTLIEHNSEDCGYIEPIYQWVTVSGEYVCDGTTKYAKEKEQVSYDSGSTWSDTGNTRTGSEIETESFDCGYVAYRWVADTGYVCVGFDKYNKEKEQSTTDGINWTDTGNTRAGSNLIETLSTDCGVLYQWVTIPDDTICVGYDLYSREKQQYSTDNGTTWVDTGNTRTGSVKEQDSYDCGYDPSIVPLTLVSPTGINNLEFRHSGDVSSFEISYKYEDSDTWTRSTSDISIGLPANKRVYFKGSFTTTGSIGSFYASSGKISVRGNIMSLIYNDNFLNQTSLAGKNYIFKELFAMLREHITDADKLTLPATTLSEGCYFDMFDNAWGLTKVPALPATTLAAHCYDNMFNGCDHLLNVPTDLLPATTLAAHCYDNMFSHCHSLINPPALPATTLAESCYNAMFWQCYALTVTPVLPAPILVQSCYEYMFYNCTHLIDVTCCATDISATHCILGWLDKINTIGVFHKDASATWMAGTDGIPRGWTIDSCGCGHDYSREYLTTEALGNGDISLEKGGSDSSKEPITNIQYSKNDGAWTSYTYGTNISVVTGDKIRWKATLNDGNSNDYYSHFGATADYKVYGNPLSLFDNDSFVNKPNVIHDSYYHLFENNSTLKDASELALLARTLTKKCYIGMFYGCSSLTTAPDLNSATLTYNCYYQMFKGCTNLNYIKCLATDISAYNSTGGWVDGVSDSGTFVKNSSMSRWSFNTSGIPAGWTVRNAS